MTRLQKYFMANSTLKYIDILDKAVYAYNNTVHSSTNFKPTCVNDTNILTVYNNLNKKHKRLKKFGTLQVGDFVRISKYKGIFDKGYTANYSREIFKIYKVINRYPIVYRISDLDDEKIDGVFYGKELQKVLFNKNTSYAIDKIIKQRHKGNSIQLYVSWKGYPSKFNSWIDSKQLTK